MPNWCNNYVTLTGPKEKIDELIVEMRKSDECDEPYEILNKLRPRPESETDNWYGWNVENWGTKWDVNLAGYEIIDETTVSLSFDSAWSPPISLYEYLESEGWTVNSLYDEPGMAYCGQYADGDDNYIEYGGMSADEMESAIPSEINDMFDMVQYRRDQEDEEENEDD
jgi:hypothetical protein